MPTPACPGWSATPPNDAGTGNPGCEKWEDFCKAGVTFGCNAYFFCMTAGESAEANCTRGCIQSNVPAANTIGTGDGDPATKCQAMKDGGLDCTCLFHREAACIDACGARDLLPWALPPTPETFPPACGGPLQIQRFLTDFCPDPTIWYGGKTCQQIVNDMEQWQNGEAQPPCSVKNPN